MRTRDFPRNILEFRFSSGIPKSQRQEGNNWLWGKQRSTGPHDTSLRLFCRQT